MARKILLADDSVTAQNMGRKILADAGYDVITVNNGSAALKKIAENKPDLIVLDVYMPGYSGLEVCQRLKEAQETARIPVLLTVGKLEPFKPEEARRVRAEGYIDKPFEASELLSALSKLEDKIVPRAEPSKPGRFARANAALDEGKFDKSVTAEEDSGWKNRIGFPSKKKKADDNESDESTIYNPVNKDLRTVVEHKIGQEAKAAEARVDLGALAPEGLPKDVTPEEIAALAAAAAQVKGSLAEAESSSEQALATTLEAKAAEVVTPEAKAETAAPELKPELKREDKPAVAEAAAEPLATFAAQKPEERSEAAAGKLLESKEAAGMTVSTAAEMMAAIAGLVPEAAKLAESTSGNGSGSHNDQAKPADEPVTMAVAAAVGLGGMASRWTAVAVAPSAEEAALSLEHEMQKAHAAFAAAEAVPVPVLAAIPQIQAAVEPAAITPQAPVAEVVPTVPFEPAPTTPAMEAARLEVEKAEVSPEIASTGSVSAPAPEEFSAAEVVAAVKEFQRISGYTETPSPILATAVAQSTEPQPAPAEVQSAQPVIAAAVEAMPVIETRAEETPAAADSFAKGLSAEAVQGEPRFQELKQEERNQEEAKQEEFKQEEPKREESAPEATAAVETESSSPSVTGLPAASLANEAAPSEASKNPDEISSSQISTTESRTSAVSAEPRAASSVADETAAKDSVGRTCGQTCRRQGIRNRGDHRRRVGELAADPRIGRNQEYGRAFGPTER